MNEKLLRREVFIPLVDALNTAVTYSRLEDGEHILAALRILRPRMVELDTFEAWIAMKRGFFTDAIKVLHNVGESESGGSLATALMAFCQFATGNADWSVNANRVMQGESSKEAVGLVRLLLDPNAVETAEETTEETVTLAPPPVAVRPAEGMFLRA
jgi:type III secretion protein HrpB1